MISKSLIEDLSSKDLNLICKDILTSIEKRPNILMETLTEIIQQIVTVIDKRDKILCILVEILKNNSELITADSFLKLVTQLIPNVRSRVQRSAAILSLSCASRAGLIKKDLNLLPNYISTVNAYALKPVIITEISYHIICDMIISNVDDFDFFNEKIYPLIEKSKNFIENDANELYLWLQISKRFPDADVDELLKNPTTKQFYVKFTNALLKTKYSLPIINPVWNFLASVDSKSLIKNSIKLWNNENNMVNMNCALTVALPSLNNEEFKNFIEENIEIIDKFNRRDSVIGVINKKLDTVKDASEIAMFLSEKYKNFIDERTIRTALDRFSCKEIMEIAELIDQESFYQLNLLFTTLCSKNDTENSIELFDLITTLDLTKSEKNILSNTIGNLFEKEENWMDWFSVFTGIDITDYKESDNIKKFAKKTNKIIEGINKLNEKLEIEDSIQKVSPNENEIAECCEKMKTSSYRYIKVIGYQKIHPKLQVFTGFFELQVANKGDFSLIEGENTTFKGPFSTTKVCMQTDSKDIFALRQINTVKSKEDVEKFIDICKTLIKMNYPCMMKVSYVLIPKENTKNIPTICTLYNEGHSLLSIVDSIINGERDSKLNNTQTMIILYGIALFLKNLHKGGFIHGRIKLSNIILNENYEPMVTDTLLNQLTQIKKDLPIDYIISVSPEEINGEEITEKADIYSFGILAYQLLTKQINLYANITDDKTELREIISRGQKPKIKGVPPYMKDLISKCLSSDIEERPSANDIVNLLDKIITDEREYDEKQFTLFKENINKVEEIDEKLKNMKELADKGDLESIYDYGREIYYKEKTQENTREAMKYLRYASRNGHEGAQILYDNLVRNKKEDNQSILEQERDNIYDENDTNKKQENKFVHLKDDPFFTEEKVDIDKIIRSVEKNYTKVDKSIYDKIFNEEELRKKNFIFTPGAKDRLIKLYDYIDAGVPVLLEGPTGTSKTLSSEIVCNQLHKTLIRFNLSSETKSADLLGRYVGDSDSWAGISMVEGPFITAFKKGYTLLLDEINLASQECLQFIEEALDSGVISTEIPGMPLKEIYMNPEFRLIATQNPNKGLFAHKRQDLGIKFLSRFQVINFPAFTKDELLGIAKGLAKGFKYRDYTLIEQLVNFHMEWSSNPEIADDVQCFTVREIAATVSALSKNENPFDTVMTIYGARYQKDMREKLKKCLLSYNKFVESDQDASYPQHFPECFHNLNLSQALKSVQFSFKNHRHVILAAQEGYGITQISRWISSWYDETHKSENNIIDNDEDEFSSNDEKFFCVCTQETKCSDLIGSQKPLDNVKEGQELIKWKNGFLTKAIKRGKCAVLDSLDEAPSTVTERLNALLDKKYDGEDKMFDIPENPNENQVPINPNFRLLCTCNIDKINQMSPAFVNRFDVIVLENQLENISEIKGKELIKILIKQANITKCVTSDGQETNIPSTTSHQEENNENNEEEDFAKWLCGDDEEEEEEEEDENEERNESNTENKQVNASSRKSSVQEVQFEPSEELINLIYNVFESTKPTIFKLSQFCRAVSIYTQKFEGKNILPKDIVEFTRDMLMKNDDFVIKPTIQDLFISDLSEQKDSDDNKFFFKDSPQLCSFIAKLYAASLINLPVCVYGPTGAGKTSAARAFARIRPCKLGLRNQFQMHSFHAGTKPNNFYGTTTLKDGKIHFINGTLTIALKTGATFIADEMNLSSISNMKSLAPALEPCIGQSIFIPGIGENITIHRDFFFIACQNELGTIGRNAIPSSIASRFRYFDYPKQKTEDISKICCDIANSFYENRSEKCFEDSDAQNIGKYMIDLNSLKQRVIPQWSLRDITKLFQRIHYQDTNPSDFINVSFYHNILFYTMSPVSNEDVSTIFSTVCELIGDTFNLSVDKRRELMDCYNAVPKIKQIEGKGYFLMKGNCGISYRKFEKDRVGFGLPSLLNGIFQLLLSDYAEPILLMGPSGFKTFLAQQFLYGTKVITLNQESTISQLLGSSAFLTDSEAKIFYSEMICKICRIYNESSELNKMLENGEMQKMKETLKKLIDIQITSIPQSFKYAVDHLFEKLFSEKPKEQEDNALSNITLEFRPGLFLSAILEGKSLILKNLHNLPTIILERFNELFSGKHNLTLNEDIHNTFTGEKKELTNFSDNFRVFATCPPNTATKLSEAVLSRFSVIYVPEYKAEEQEKVLKSYSSFNRLHFSDDLIRLIINFSEYMKDSINKTISFPQMINIIEICSRLNDEKNTDMHIKNLGIILYRIISGIVENRSKLKDKIIGTFNSLEIPLPENIKIDISEDPLEITTKNEYQGVRSKITGHFIESASTKEVPPNIAFTPMIVEMIDIVHFGLVANIPIIFEGMPGQGKQTAIKRVADILGYDIINIVISNSSKVDDLLGKVSIVRDKEKKIHVKMIETKLVKAFKSSSSSNSIVAFHNINNASPAVLEVLDTIFNPHQKDILLPDGSTIPKGKTNLIAIFNPQNGISNRDKLPQSLITSSIYHIVKNPKNADVRMVVENLFSNTPFGIEATSFYNRYKETKKIASESSMLSTLTLNDIKKYVIFRNATFGKFDETTISQMIFAYRFIQQETIDKVIKQTGIGEMKSNPVFTYSKQSKELFIKISNDAKTSISLPLFSDEIEDEKILSIITCLTLPQKHCLLFLACSLLSKRSCIVQGATASGKSHIIRLFAKMLGQKLNVYQMNNDTGISIITGQSVLSNTLSKDDVYTFKEAFADLNNIQEIKKYIKKKFGRNPSDWTPKVFSDLLKFIEEYKENEEDLSEKELNYINSAEKKIKQAILPANRFQHQESAFVKAMENGEWVLIDGIESAPSEIAEKIASLCGDNPELDLVECGEGFYFTKNKSPKSKPIHENFHLFVTYNPTSKSETKMLDSAFINKCVSFTLPPMDSTPENSAQILLGSMIELSYPSDVSVEIGARMAMMHSVAKIESSIDNDSFAGDIEFTGRTLKFISKEFGRHKKDNKKRPEKDIYKPICHSLHTYYTNSYINEKKEKQFQKKLVDEFSRKDAQIEEIKKSVDFKGVNQKQRYMSILVDLRNIQVFAYNNEKLPKFNFFTFTKNCSSVQLTDVPFIYKHLYDTKNIIEQKCMGRNLNRNMLEREYTQINIILQIFEQIKDGLSSVKPELANIQLKDLENDIESIKKPIMQLHLLIKLQGNGFNYINPMVSSLVYNSTICDIMEVAAAMYKNQDLGLFSAFMSELSDHKNMLPIIDNLFPYSKFFNNDFKNICYWLPLFYELHNNSISFNVNVNDEVYNFKYKEPSEFEPTFVFKTVGKLNVSPSTKIHFNNLPKKNNSFTVPKCKPKEQEKANSVIYKLVKFFIENPRRITVDILMAQIKNCSKGGLPPNPRKESYACIRQFCPIEREHKSPLISRIWAIIYSQPANTIQIIANNVNPLEAELLSVFYNIFQRIDSLSTMKILDLTKWMIGIGAQDSILWKVKNDIFTVQETMGIDEAKSLINKINQESIYLKKSPPFDDHFWSSKTYIQLLDECIQKVDKLIQKKINDNRELLLKSKMEKLINRLNKAELTDNKFKPIRQKISQEISMQLNSVTEEKYMFYEKQVKKFFDCISSVEVSLLHNNILWPSYSSDNVIDLSPEVKLYKNIIWYSEIMSIYDKILDENNTNVIKDIIQLNDYTEVQSVVQFLLKRSMNQTENQTFLPHEIDAMYSTVNAHFICKLKKDNIIDKIGKLDEILNKLIERDEISETDNKWIHKIANKYPPDFNLVLPQFKAMDLFFLFACYQGDDSTVAGPLIYDLLKRNDLANAIKPYMFSKQENMVECSNTIAEILYRMENRRTSPPSDRQSLKKSFSKGKQIGKCAIFVMNLADKLQGVNEFIFELETDEETKTSKFPDIKFMQNDWIKNASFVNQYQSLTYWLCKNSRCANQLTSYFSKLEYSNKKLPFWLFTLRLMSSNSCINFEIEEETKLGKQICKKVKDTYLQLRYSELGTDWLSFMLQETSSIPSDMVIPKYKIFHKFLSNLAKDEDRYNNYKSKEKTRCILSFTENISKLIFTSKINELMDLTIEEDNDDILFIKDPESFVSLVINNKLSQIYEKVRSFDEFSQLVDYMKMVNNCFSDHLSDLEKTIIDENTKKQEKFMVIEEDKAKREKYNNTQKINRINELKNKYSFSRTKEEKKELLDLIKQLPPALKKETKIYKYKYIAVIDDYERQIDNMYDQSINNSIKRIPHIIFKKSWEPIQDIFDFLINVKEKCNDVVNCIENDFMNESVTEKTFSYIKHGLQIPSNLSAKFSDGEQSPIVDEKITMFIKMFNQMATYLKNLEKRIYNNSIGEEWSDFASARKVFTNSYNLPLPHSVSSHPVINQFDNIKNANILSSPILSIEKGSIACCFDSLSCSIGPIIASLYSKKVAINFVSFIEEAISIDIETEDDKYSDWFTSKHNIIPGDPVQLLISIPYNDTEEPIEYKFSSNIIVTSHSFTELTIPCEFSIVSLPLAFLISCKEYKLSYEKGSFYLCTNRVLSGSSLTFSINNYNTKEPTNFCYQLTSLDDNAAKEPIVDAFSHKNLIKIEIPTITSITRIHSVLKIAFSNTFSVNIIIDSAIVPFDFAFDVYDYMEGKYVADTLTIYNTAQSIRKPINLHCRIRIPSFAPNFPGKIACTLPYNVKSNLSGIKKDFTIENDMKFDINLELRDKVKTYNNNYNICVKINGIEKKIAIKFDQVNLREIHQFTYKFPIYKQKPHSKEWIPVENKADLDKEMEFIVTPFESYWTKEVKIDYYSKPNNCVRFNLNDPCLGKSIIIAAYESGEWYPMFRFYPKYKFKLDELEINDDNVKIVDKAFKEINDKNNSENNFNRLAKALTKESQIGNIEDFAQKQKKFIKDTNIKGEIDKLVQDITNIEENDPKNKIILFNFIVILFKLFKGRYDNIDKNHGFIKPHSINQNDIDKKINQCLEEYYKVDKHAESLDCVDDTHKKFDQYEETFNKMNLHKVSEDQETEAFLIFENAEPKPKKYEFKPKYISKDTNQNMTSKNKAINVTIPTITIPSNEEVEKMTISELEEFYTSCTQGTRVLPVFVRNILIQPKEALTLKKQAKDCFLKLLQVYESVPENDMSFISTEVNTFSHSFETMISKFKKSGINFTAIVPAKCVINDEEIHDFIQYPEKDKIFISQGTWNIKEKLKFDDIDFDPAAVDAFKVDVSNASKVDNNTTLIDSEDQLDIHLTQADTENKTDLTSGDLPNDFSYARVVINKNDQHEEEDENDTDDTSNENILNKPNEEIKQSAIVISNDETKTTLVKSEQFDGMVSHFTESDGIERAISRMKEMNKASPLKIKNAPEHKFNSQFLRPENNGFSIDDLIKQSHFLCQEFIKAASDSEVPFSNISVNILVDCSSFISDENKIFNMMIICALTNALEALKIPYSAAVIADQNFKCIIKPFNEDHSKVALQRICDCLLIKRYRTKLASSLDFAIHSMGYNIDDTRKHRAIFTFSDGLDEQLVLTKSWAETIFNDPNLSFGFVFIKSSQLVDENVKFVEKVWSDFEKEVKVFDSRSNMKVAPIKAEISTDLLEKLYEMFASVMNRESVVNIKDHNHSFSPVNFTLQNNLSNLDMFSKYIGVNYSGVNGIYTERTDSLNNAASVIDKLDASKYKNKLLRIAEFKTNNSISQDEYHEFLRTFIQNRRILNQAILETCFKPNKASQTVLSTTGTDFDITALILNLINPVPDPMIYLEEKGGLIRNYGVSIVIDPSTSCFNQLSGAHSLQTIRTVLSYLASIDLPCFDLIVAGDPNPTVICSEVGTLRALNSRSPLWGSLFTILQHPLQRVDIASAIHTAFDLRRMRSTEYTSMLFVITDGLYQSSERVKIIDCVNNCVQSGMTTIGVGSGIYPKGIEKLFPQVVFSPNPFMVMKGIASFFGDNISEVFNTMPSIKLPQPEPKELRDAITSIINGKDSPVFPSLKRDLHDITPALDAFDDFYNEEQDVGNDDTGFKNPVGKNTEIYVKNLLKSQKILIVMLWDHTMSKSEEEFVAKEYIFKSSVLGRSECIKTAVDHFGIELDVVQNYEDAINKLTHQTRPGYCDYYATWIFCGPPYEILPDKSADPNLVGQFNEVLIKFWKNGGSLVFWAEGKPLTYQVNLFLETVDFEHEIDCPSGKTELRIDGEHEGRQILLGEESDELKNYQKFNRSPRMFKECQRTILSHNIGKIFEGITISYAEYDLEKIKPFKPFSRDSEGGISSLFYTANLQTGTGDIVIDCGYTKCFTQLTSDGTFRYIQNIAGWTARPEIHCALEKGIQPSDWRPKAVTHDLKKGIKWNGFQKLPSVGVDVKSLRTLWAIDCSGSVGGSSLYHGELQNIVNEYYKPGDDIWMWDHGTRHYSKQQLDYFISNKEGHGGTSSELIAEIASSSSIREHLIIVTDGQVGSSSIDESDRRMRNYNIKFQAVTTFVIGSGGNLSVGAPYSRGCQNVTYSVRSIGCRNRETSLSNQDLQTLSNINRINYYSDFINQFNSLDSAIQAKMLGSSADSSLTNDLNNLRQRVINNSNMSSSDLQNFNSKFRELYNMANGALRNTFTLDSIAAAKKN